VARLEDNVNDLIDLISAGAGRPAPEPTSTVAPQPPVPAGPILGAPVLATHGAPSGPAVADVGAVVPGSAAATHIQNLAYSLPSPGADAVSAIVGTRAAYAEDALLCMFQKPSLYPPFPNTVFFPEDLGAYAKIKSADARDGYEA
jgi:hypothetical protein